MQRILAAANRRLSRISAGMSAGLGRADAKWDRARRSVFHQAVMSTLCLALPLGLAGPEVPAAFAPCISTSLIEGWRPRLCWVIDGTCWLAR